MRFGHRKRREPSEEDRGDSFSAADADAALARIREREAEIDRQLADARAEANAVVERAMARAQDIESEAAAGAERSAAQRFEEILSAARIGVSAFETRSAVERSARARDREARLELAVDYVVKRITGT